MVISGRDACDFKRDATGHAQAEVGTLGVTRDGGLESEHRCSLSQRLSGEKAK